MPSDRERADRRAALAALVSASVMIAQQVGGKATRDALFLSSFEPEDLPRAVIAAAGASMLAVFAATRAQARLGPAKVVPVAFAVSALLYMVEWILHPRAPHAIAVILFLHTAVFGALVISGFWSVVNERFDPYAAKGVISRIGTGATFGGVVGGLLAERVGERGDAAMMLLFLALLNSVAAVGVTRIGGGLRARLPEHRAASALAVLRRSSYLRSLAALVLLTAVSAALVDYAFKARAAAHFEQGSDALLRFFAIFHVAAALLSFLLQTSLARPALEKLGVAGTVATLPIVVLLSAAVSSAVTRLSSVAVTRAAELVVANSIFRNGYELLYTPVAPERKRPTKALIDVAFNRAGDAVGSAAVIAVLASLSALGFASAGISVVLGMAAAVAAASLVVARRLHRGYLRQLEDKLRSGTPEAAARDQLDAATLQTLSTIGLDREALFEQLAAQQSWSERSTHPAIDGREDAATSDPGGIEAPREDPVHQTAKLLRAGSASEIGAALEGDALDPRLAGHLIALLARRDVYQDAIAALRRSVTEHPSVVHAATAALLDPDQPFAIRRRLPRVLEVSASEEVTRALAAGLDDARFEVRYRCALALARIAARAPGLRPPAERIHGAVRAELEASRKVWDSRHLLDEDADEDAPLLSRALRDRVHRSVEHVFTLLSLGYDPEPLRLALIALTGDDPTLRGTALEYLENVLPEPIREALFPMLDVRVAIRRRRPREQIVEELIRSMRSVDPGALQQAIHADVDAAKIAEE